MRSTNCHGPTQTGAVPNLSPSLLAAVGETGIPERSARIATSGEKGLLSLSRTVRGSTTSMLLTDSSSLRRLEPFMLRWRSSEYRTDSAFMGGPALNLEHGRRLVVSDLAPSLI